LLAGRMQYPPTRLWTLKPTRPASVAFTMDTYSHIISGMQEDMMALLDEVLPVGINGVKNSNANFTENGDK